MESLYLLIPLSIAIVFLALWVFFTASDSGQFDDLVGPGLRILQDDDRGVDGDGNGCGNGDGNDCGNGGGNDCGNGGGTGGGNGGGNDCGNGDGNGGGTGGGNSGGNDQIRAPAPPESGKAPSEPG